MPRAVAIAVCALLAPAARAGDPLSFSCGPDGDQECGGRPSAALLQRKIESSSLADAKEEDAESDMQAHPFNNIEEVVRGYNIYYADPTPPEEYAGSDPGLRKPVFTLAYTRGGLTGDRRHMTPDGYHATLDVGCSTAFTSKSIRDSYEYTQETVQEIALTASAKANIGASFPPSGKKDKGKKKKKSKLPSIGAKVKASATASLSHKDQEIRNENELREQRMEKSVAQCASYVAAIEYGAFPETAPEFKSVVHSLGSDAERYYDLFDDFGTHYLAAVKMGARYSEMTYIRNDKYDTVVTKMKGLGLTVDVAASASASLKVSKKKKKSKSKDKKKKKKDPKHELYNTSGSWDLLSPKEKEAADELAVFIEKDEISYVGPELGSEGVAEWAAEVAEDPAVIRVDKREICLHPEFEGEVQEQCFKHLEGYCWGRLAAKGARCREQEETECMVDLECPEDFLCRHGKCEEAPVCRVTLCKHNLWRGCDGGYTLPGVMHHKAAEGRIFDLKNGDWWDEVSSLKLSDGCSKVEAMDDDGQCRQGEPDNRYYTKDGDLPRDLDDDVCKVRVWAKPLYPLPPTALVAEGLNSSDAPPAPKAVPGLAQLNDKLALRWKRRQGLARPAVAAPPPATSLSQRVEEVKPKKKDRRGAPRPRPARLTRPLPKLKLAEAADGSAAERLEDGGPAPGGYIKNIGKAMYGYNHYFASPMSSNQAGTDPGFRHRAVWEDAYTRGTRAHYTTFQGVPGQDARTYVVVQVGAGGGKNEKCIDNQEGAVCASDSGNQGQRVNKDHASAGDSFFVTTDEAKKQICVRRLDSEGSWGMNLALSCYTVAPLPDPAAEEETSLKVPDGWKVKLGKSPYCEKEFRSDSIKSAHDYSAKVEDSFKLKVPLGKFSFGASTESQDFVSRNSKEGKMLVTTSAECVEYVAEIDDTNPPPTDPSFQFVAEAASEELEFYALFDMFGLHYPSAVVFGSRYGFSRYIDEQNYKNFREESSVKNLSATVSYSVGMKKKGGVSAKLKLSAEVGLSEGQKTKITETVEKFFMEVKEFSVGKRMPDEGGMDEWVKSLTEEPMPTRFDLVSICEHPAFAKAGTQEACREHSQTYCEKHLQHAFEGISCDPQPAAQCLWDIDCGKHKICEEGSCVPEPECTVTIYEDDDYRGHSKTLGPNYRREHPNGQVFDLGWFEDEISSLKISGGCEEVVLMDEDGCNEVYEDNMLLSLRDGNKGMDIPDLPTDLNNDMCQIKVLAKTKWFA